MSRASRNAACQRHPVALLQAVEKRVAVIGQHAPHYVPKDHPLVKELMKTYREYTGRNDEPLAIGGGTYVHGLRNGVAFGCTMPGTDNRMHGADENAVIDELVISAEMRPFFNY